MQETVHASSGTVQKIQYSTPLKQDRLLDEMRPISNKFTSWNIWSSRSRFTDRINRIINNKYFDY